MSNYSIKFLNNGISGFAYFHLKFRLDNNPIELTNQIYRTIPTEFGDFINCIEIFDTKNFIDIIDTEVILEFKNIINNKIETNLIIDDELIKLEYNGLLEIVN